MANLDADLVRHALETARQHGFTSVKLEVGEHKFAAEYGTVAYADESGVSEEPNDAVPAVQDVVIEAPCVGYFRPANPPLAVGDAVNTGDVVGSVIALGLATDIASPVSGVVTTVDCEPDQPVEFGQRLLAVTPE